MPPVTSRALPLLLLLCALALALSARPADAAPLAPTGEPAYPVGLSMAWGVGALGVRDEAISRQRYAGTLPAFGAAWAADHGRYLYRAGVEWRQADDIRNHSVRTDIRRFSLGQAFLYPLSPRTLTGRRVLLYAGPSMDLILFDNEQRIAVDALGFAESVCVLVSLGARAEALVPLTSRLTGHGSLHAGLLSLGVRAVDDETDDASPAKLLLPWTGTAVAFEAGVDCRLTARFAMSGGYRLQLLRVRAWHGLLSVSDDVVARVTCRL